MTQQPEPRNPLYLLLLLVGIVFAVTVLAVAVVPVLEQKAMDAGEVPPPSPFRDALRQNGWQWVLYEVAALVVLGLASMGLDRWRRLKNERASATIPQNDAQPPLVG
ncbi:MAG: hypothetical protein HY040_19700 [Planctomycetes bacterium]|nr:hypothetical protein [Planctomycetota bacterium]